MKKLEKENDYVNGNKSYISIRVLLVYTFLLDLSFWAKNVFFTISETDIRKKSKFLLKGFCMDKKVAYKIS